LAPKRLKSPPHVITVKRYSNGANIADVQRNIEANLSLFCARPAAADGWQGLTTYVGKPSVTVATHGHSYHRARGARAPPVSGLDFFETELPM